MILPDDKNPTIVWDQAAQVWKNTAGDDDESSAPKGPPPKDSDLMGTGGSAPSSYPPPYPNMQSQMSMPQPNSQNSLNNHGLPNNQPYSIQNQPNAPQNQQPNMAQSQPTNNVNGGPASIGSIQAPTPGPNKFLRPKGLSKCKNFSLVLLHICKVIIINIIFSHD